MTQAAPDSRFYIGTYTSADGADGIYMATLDRETGDLHLSDSVAPAINPSFLRMHPDGRWLYAVSETALFEGRRTGAVMAFAVAPATGALTLLNQQPSGGTLPCHLTLDPLRRQLLVANYGSGTVSVLPIAEDGSLAAPAITIQHSETGTHPHAHSVTLSPDGRFAYAADLGLDRIMIYDRGDAQTPLAPAVPDSVSLAAGAGPRHFAFRPGHAQAYVVNELNSTLTAFVHNAASGSLTAFATVSTLPDDFDGKNSGADLHIAADGRFLYASNRGHDSIAVFRIDDADGHLIAVAHTPTGGATPRNFALSPDGHHLLVANQNANHIAVFTVDPETGTLTPAGRGLDVPRPVCIRFAPPF